MLDRIEFLLAEAFVALRRNLIMTMAAITTAAMALFLLGGLAYVYMRITEFGSKMEGKYEMRVFLRDGVDEATIKQTITDIRGIEGVKQVVWIPRDKAWEKFQKENPEVTEGLDVGNPIPEGYKVVLADLSQAGLVSAKIQALPAVEQNGIVRMQAAEQMLTDARSIAVFVGGVFGTLMLITAAVLIYNAIRLTVIARRREIRIMQLVGASHFTVRTPFIIEGMVQGAIGGALASLFILLCQRAIQNYIHDNVSVSMHVSNFPIWTWLWVLGVIGAFFGFVCSAIALREPLKFRPKVVQG